MKSSRWARRSSQWQQQRQRRRGAQRVLNPRTPYSGMSSNVPRVPSGIPAVQKQMPTVQSVQLARPEAAAVSRGWFNNGRAFWPLPTFSPVCRQVPDDLLETTKAERNEARGTRPGVRKKLRRWRESWVVGTGQDLKEGPASIVRQQTRRPARQDGMAVDKKGGPAGGPPGRRWTLGSCHSPLPSAALAALILPHALSPSGALCRILAPLEN